uniref:L-ornithine N(5)-monooxygenase n=1 Tax=Omphalotus olearius TaxID=72120 RepID=SIDA_OMPOL|nr:RecName: Full=L-ornithine N(5)-monooxygenase; Short=OMO; AltName: Full=Ferrichrome A biosynthesis protein omo1; AltName: Full=L-ornithine N(5)-oxygenase; AltName: Full=Siderophore biosynthesis protein omo1 [Omphalotus olearius]AAX49355.1 putative L-ornithine-N5-monooxygenase [Omphalotus olearius]
MSQMSITSQVIYDLVGLGFGPSNVAIAGALVDKWASPNSDAKSRSFQNVLFIEKHTSFQWHPGMLIPGAQMQISFLKDLATLRSPQSPITFLNYLHSQNRLASFINRGSTTPSRKEYADYLGWAARYVQDHGVKVNYGQEVIAIDEDADGLIGITSKDVTTNEIYTYKTRNLVISPGGSPRIPLTIAPLMNEPSVINDSTVLHSSAYLTSVDRLFQSLTRSSSSRRPFKIAVVGGGQSAAEVSLNLRERLSSIAFEGSVGHQVDMIIGRGSLKPSDDTPFSNEVFDPMTTDTWFGSSQHNRDRMITEYKPTNYSVVNPRTINAVRHVSPSLIYDQKVDDAIAARTLEDKTSGTSPARINIRANMRIVSLKYDDKNSTDSSSSPTTKSSSAFTLTLQNTHTPHTLHASAYDAIICATGYQRTGWIDMFKRSKRLGKHFGIGAEGAARVKLVPLDKRQRVDVDTLFDETAISSDVSSTASSSLYSVSGSDNSAASGVSGASTPLTSPSEEEGKSDVNLYISRRYRLLPVSTSSYEKTKTRDDDASEGVKMKARIYVQGVEEMTHGLSDTLLSVIGPRAGEVVEDLFAEE